MWQGPYPSSPLVCFHPVLRVTFFEHKQDVIFFSKPQYLGAAESSPNSLAALCYLQCPLPASVSCFHLCSFVLCLQNQKLYYSSNGTSWKILVFVLLPHLLMAHAHGSVHTAQLGLSLSLPPCFLCTLYADLELFIPTLVSLLIFSVP